MSRDGGDGSIHSGLERVQAFTRSVSIGAGLQGTSSSGVLDCGGGSVSFAVERFSPSGT